jgi:hypothetical protein
MPERSVPRFGGREEAFREELLVGLLFIDMNPF